MNKWQNRFDRLLKAMASGEPHKASGRSSALNDDTDRSKSARAQKGNSDGRIANISGDDRSDDQQG